MVVGGYDVHAGEGAQTLRILLLGAPEVLWRGEAVCISRRQVRALLYRLAARQEPVSRDQLCFLFWPDTPDATARRCLTHILTHLRLALPIPQLILFLGDAVQLNAACAWSDTVWLHQVCCTRTADLNPGSAIKIGLLENGQCVDRNGDGDIDTSTGLGDIRPWLNPGGVDNGGGVSSAEDECILIYQRLPNAPNARHVSVDAQNNVWVGGYPYFPTTFHKLNGATGAILASFSPDCGGYGGLIDGNNVLWSAAISQNQLLRYDLTANSGACIGVSQSYGLGIDTNGYIWNAMWTNDRVVKISPAGAIQAGFPVPTGGSASRGVVITASDNHVWIANSNSNTVTRLDNNGALLATIPVGNQPTGVAVDGAGKVWVTNYSSDDVRRIDPATNSVDLTVSLGAGAGPYNYSDMTGSTLIAPPNTGTWTVVHDSGVLDAVWGFVTWNALTPGDSSLQVYAASSTDGSTFSAEEMVANGVDLSVPDGQYLRVRVQFNRATTGESPILYDLTILANRPPDCTNAAPSVSRIWPPNHQSTALAP